LLLLTLWFENTTDTTMLKYLLQQQGTIWSVALVVILIIIAVVIL